MEDEDIYTISVTDYLFSNGKRKTTYGASCQNAHGGGGLESLKELSELIISQAALGRTNYINQKGFQITIPDKKLPSPSSPLRFVKRGLHQQELERLEKMLTYG